MLPGVMVTHKKRSRLFAGLGPDSVVLKRAAKMSRPCQAWPTENTETSLGLALARLRSASDMRP